MASWGFLAWAFVLGSCLGSFYGACSYRYVHALSLRGRSFCPQCNQQLWPQHMIPIVSWLFLKGRCAFCRAPIGYASTVVECLSGLTALLLAAHYGPSPAFFATLLFFGALTVLASIDAACFILPDSIVVPLTPAALLISVWVLHMDWLSSLTGGLAGAALLFGLRRLFFALRGMEGLGLGDVKLMLPLGFMCGLHNMPLLLLVASLSGLAGMAWQLRRTPGHSSVRMARIPFGPFLAFGSFITVLYGEYINGLLV